MWLYRKHRGRYTMENKYPRLISWNYWDGTSIFSRKTNAEEIIEYYILDEGVKRRLKMAHLQMQVGRLEV